MNRRYSVFAIVACALCAHCNDDDNEWEREGRVYATAEVAVTRADSSPFADTYSVAAGDVVYSVSFEIHAGTLPSGAGGMHPFVFLPVGLRLAPGDEPIVCEVFAEGEREYNKCATYFTGAGPNNSDLAADRDEDAWSTSALRASARRVTFEVRRPADAPALDGTKWTVTLADEACALALDAHYDSPSCAKGAECSTGQIDYQVDATRCRWRNKDD